MNGPTIDRAVTVLCASSERGGAETLVRTLVAALSRLGVPTDLFIPSSPSAALEIDETLSWYEETGVRAKIHALFSRDAKGFRNVQALAHLLRGQKNTLVNIHYNTLSAVSLTDVVAVRLAGKRCVLSIHHPTPWHEMTPNRRATIGIALWLSDTVIATTRFTADLISERKLTARNIEVVPCGVPTPTSRISRIDARKMLGIADDAFVVSCIARQVHYKGVAAVIEGTANLSAATDIVLLIAGQGPELDANTTVAKSLLGDRARVFGYVEDIGPILAASNVFALPSKLEGFGLVYVEAALYGVPSIAANTGGAPHVVIHNNTGIIVPPCDPYTIADAIHRLYNQRDTLMHMGSAAYSRAMALYTDTAMAKGYINVLWPDRQ